MKAARGLACAVWFGAVIIAPACAQSSEAATSQRIAAERAAAEVHYSERLRACQQHFAVTACVEAAQRERRETLVRLKHEQFELDEGARKARAAERAEALYRRMAAHEQRASDAATGASRPSAGESSRRAPSAPRPVAPVASTPRSGGSGSASQPSRSEAEARSRANFDAAQQAAAAHRAEVEARNANRALHHKPASPLPVPSGASAP